MLTRQEEEDLARQALRIAITCEETGNDFANTAARRVEKMQQCVYEALKQKHIEYKVAVDCREFWYIEYKKLRDQYEEAVAFISATPDLQKHYVL